MNTRTVPGSPPRWRRSRASFAGCSSKTARKSKRTRLHRRFANNLLKIWPALWTFVTVEGVEPTNNAAERSLRGPVIHRKLSYGSQSPDGERFIERALSASVTCRLQDRSLFAYLTELLATHARGDPLPALA
jgi:Transposase IS66 family